MLGAELRRCPVSQRRVRSHTVEIAAPRLKVGAGLGQRAKQGLVQALVPQSTDEALNKRILLRLAGCDVVPVDIPRPCPVQDRLAGELGAVVRNAALGSASTCDHCIKFPGVNRRRKLTPNRRAILTPLWRSWAAELCAVERSGTGQSSAASAFFRRGTRESGGVAM